MHKRFFQSKLQGEDEQIGYSCVIYEGRKSSFIPTPFCVPKKPADKLLLPYYGREDLNIDTCFILGT